MGEGHTMEQGLALPCGSVPQSDQSKLAGLGRDDGLAGTSQSAHAIGTPQQMPLHSCAACRSMYVYSHLPVGALQRGTTKQQAASCFLFQMGRYSCVW